MLIPQFVYPISGTLWNIIILKGAKHFYYDSATKSSVWQFSDTEIGDLAGKVNFDDLAVLFAKSNGVQFGVKLKPPVNLQPASRESEIPDLPSDIGVSEENHDPFDDNSQNELETGVTPEESPLPPQETPSAVSTQGLSLGYSSSEEESYNGSENESESHAGLDVNSGLDLGLDLEIDDGDSSEPNLDEQTKAFEAILDEYEDDFSKNDPWMLVEEELLPKFASHSGYYNIPESSRKEKIFNSWIAKKSREAKEVAPKNVFPTDVVNFYRYLQDHKSEVKKKYYVEFERSHKSELGPFESSDCNLEALYRQLRVTLNDISALERAKKSRKVTEGKNFKVQHVELFLAEENLAKHAGDFEFAKLDATLSAFDQWMQLCNRLSLPERLVNDPRNFILGDEKRVLAYIKVLLGK